MIESVRDAVSAAKVGEIQAIVQAELDNNADPLEILSSMVAAMDIIGERFQKGEIFVPEMLITAMTMKSGVEIIKPLMTEGATAGLGKFIIGTVLGDLHDIGKNLVVLMLESAGFDVIDLGVDVDIDKFVNAVKENPDCKLVGMSALLTTTMGNMKLIIEAIKEAGLGDQVQFMVGGAPLSPQYAEEIGANYSADASEAVKCAKKLLA